MAVENKYIDANVAAGKRGSGPLVEGGALRAMPFTFEVAAADTDASVYRVMKNVDPTLIPVKFDIFNDAITGGTVYDLGLYESELGAVIDADVFAANLDMSSAAAHASPKDGLTTVDVANVQKRIYEHAGHTLLTKKIGYDIAFTADTVGSGAGTISGVLYFAQG